MELEQSQAEPVKVPASKNLPFILSIVGCVLAVGLGIALFTLNQQAGRQISELSQANQKLQTDLTQLKTESEQLKLNVASYEHERKLNFVNRLSHYIEQGAVTDDLVVEKVIFNVEDPTKLYAMIDTSTQPRMAAKYKGSGKFDMQDREVKAMMGDILNEVKESYNLSMKNYQGSEPLPDWDSGQYDVTVKNYEVGTYSNGVFKLKGEQ